MRDALRKSGASAIEKDKFPFFEDLDSILSSRPTSSPVNVVESASPANHEPELATDQVSFSTENNSESGE